MLTIARSLMGNPRLPLLDGPSEGLALLLVRTVRDAVQALKAAGMAIVPAEQNPDFVLALADRVHVLAKGAVPLGGTAAELPAAPLRLERYLSA